MIRALFTAVLVSSILGTGLGFGIAYAFLSINAWQPESESKTQDNLAQIALAQVTDPNAKASIEETTHNFGAKDVKASGTHDYYIKNIGTADLILRLDRTSCSCTGIDITPTRVPPGQTATCRLKYNADRAMTGTFTQGGVIMTNDPEHREIRLTIEGMFTDPVVVQPSPVTLPKVVAGATHTATVRFYSFEEEPLQLSTPTWQDREHLDFQWKISELNETEKENSFISLAKSVIEGTITIKPGLPVGPFQDWFQFKTNYPNHTNISFLVSGQVVGGNVSISGRGYDKRNGIASLGSTVVGKKIEREFQIQFIGSSAPSAAVDIQAVEPDWIRAELSPPKDAGPLRLFMLTIEIPEDAPSVNYVLRDGGQQAHVTLKTNDESMPIVKIPLQFAVGR